MRAMVFIAQTEIKLLRKGLNPIQPLFSTKNILTLYKVLINRLERFLLILTITTTIKISQTIAFNLQLSDMQAGEVDHNKQ